MHQSTTTLETIPGIGPSLARAPRDLGFSEPAELRARNPEQMFDDLCELRAQKIDRCVLYTFRCAVYYVSNEKHDAELLKRWNWKDRGSGSSRRD